MCLRCHLDFYNIIIMIILLLNSLLGWQSRARARALRWPSNDVNAFDWVSVH